MLVSMSPCCGASCAKKFALLGLMVCVSAKKFALHAQNTPKSAFSGVLGEFFRGRVAGGAVLGEFFRANRYCAGLGCSAAHFRLAAVGVCSIRSLASACRGSNDAISPLGWCRADSRAGLYVVRPAISHVILP